MLFVYYRGNNITSLKELQKLQALPMLRALVLSGMTYDKRHFTGHPDQELNTVRESGQPGIVPNLQSLSECYDKKHFTGHPDQELNKVCESGQAGIVPNLQSLSECCYKEMSKL